MARIVEIVFDSFRTVYSPEKSDDNKGKPVTDQSIDYKQDYSVIWDTFKAHRNVDLNKDDISWIEFQNMLHGVLLEGVGSLCKVLEYRSYEKAPEGKNAAKQMEHKQHMHRMKMKSFYRIRKTKQQQRAELGNALHSIMSFIKSKKR
jgi:hypothetical protein